MAPSTTRGDQGRGRAGAGKDPKDNPRFVITNMKQSPQWIYERVYCQRGDIENRIKELHDLKIDRTSCTSSWANQFRVLLTAAAYVLLGLRAAGTVCARAQVLTLRERLLKLGARVMSSVRALSFVLHLPASFRFSLRSVSSHAVWALRTYKNLAFPRRCLICEPGNARHVLRQTREDGLGLIVREFAFAHVAALIE